MANIRKRGTGWQAQVRRSGFTPIIRVFPTREHAVAWARAVDSAIDTERDLAKLEQRAPNPCPVPKHLLPEHAKVKQYTLRDLAADYQRAHPQPPTCARRLEWWVERMGDKPLAEFTHKDIQVGIAELKATPAMRGGIDPAPTEKQRSDSTINRYVTNLSAALSYGVEKDAIAANPAHRKGLRVRETNDRERVLSWEEQEALLAACGQSSWPKLRLLVLLALASGARLGELMSLRYSDLTISSDGVSALLKGSKTKNGKARVIHFKGEAALELKKFPGIGRALIFPSAEDANRPARSMFRPHWRKALEQADLWHPDDPERHLYFHSLRHTAITRAVSAKAPLAAVQRFAGHSNINMTLRYTHLADQAAEDVASTLAAQESLNTKPCV